MDTGNSQHRTRTVTPYDVVVEARKLLGVRFVHQGRSPQGLDCIGFVLLVASRLDLLPLDVERVDYGRLPKEELIEKAAKHCTPVLNARPGCMVLIRFPNSAFASHAAIYTGRNLIHCYQQVNKVVEHGFRAKWPQWADSFWLLPGVKYE